MQPAYRVGPELHLGDAAQTQLLGNLEWPTVLLTDTYVALEFRTIGIAIISSGNICKWLQHA